MELVAFICAEHPDVKREVSKMGDVLNEEDFGKIMAMSFSADDLMYCLILPCEKGSPKDKELRSNGGMDDGHKYGIIKEYIPFS